MKKRFKTYNHHTGFGFKIIDSKNSNKEMFHSSCEEQAKEVTDKLNGPSLVENLPEQKADWTPKLLTVETKHHHYRYLVKSPSHLNEVCFKHLGKTELVEFDLQEQKLTKEYIDKCPDALIRSELEIDFLKINEDNRFITKYNIMIQNIKDALSKNDESKGFSLLKKLMAFEMEYDKYSLEDFDNKKL